MLLCFARSALSSINQALYPQLSFSLVFCCLLFLGSLSRLESSSMQGYLKSSFRSPAMGLDVNMRHYVALADRPGPAGCFMNGFSLLSFTPELD